MLFPDTTNWRFALGLLPAFVLLNLLLCQLQQADVLASSQKLLSQGVIFPVPKVGHSKRAFSGTKEFMPELFGPKESPSLISCNEGLGSHGCLFQFCAVHPVSLCIIRIRSILWISNSVLELSKLFSSKMWKVSMTDTSLSSWGAVLIVLSVHGTCFFCLMWARELLS